MEQQQPAPSGQQYERDLEKYRNESTQIGESLFKALDRKRIPRALVAIIRKVVLAFKDLMRWTSMMERVVREFKVFCDFVANLLSGL